MRQVICLLLGLGETQEVVALIAKWAASEANSGDSKYNLKVFHEVCSQVSGYVEGVLAEKWFYATVFQRKNLQVSSSGTVSDSLTSTDIFQDVSVKSFL